MLFCSILLIATAAQADVYDDLRAAKLTKNNLPFSAVAFEGPQPLKHALDELEHRVVGFIQDHFCTGIEPILIGKSPLDTGFKTPFLSGTRRERDFFARMAIQQSEYNAQANAKFPGSSFNCYSWTGTIKNPPAETLYANGVPVWHSSDGPIQSKVYFVVPGGVWRLLYQSEGGFVLSAIYDSTTLKIQQISLPSLEIKLAGGQLSQKAPTKEGLTSENKLIRDVQRLWELFANSHSQDIDQFAIMLATGKMDDDLVAAQEQDQ